jgi:protease-4
MKGRGAIAIIPVKGTLKTEGLYFGLMASSQGIIQAIDEVERRKKLKAAIFEINSPGGTPFAAKEVATRITAMTKPAIAWVREYATSGGYWIASACDEIVADELSTVGSVGVISIRPDIGELLKKFGVDIETLKTGMYKGLGLPYEKPTAEERELLTSELEEIKESFLSAIGTNRHLDDATLKELATAKIYLGLEAKTLGLIDHLGGKELAIARAKELAGLKREKLIDYGDRRRMGMLRRLLEELLR